MPLLVVRAGLRAKQPTTSLIMANRARTVTPEIAGFLAGFAVVTSSPLALAQRKSWRDQRQQCTPAVKRRWFRRTILRVGGEKQRDG